MTKKEILRKRKISYYDIMLQYYLIKRDIEVTQDCKDTCEKDVRRITREYLDLEANVLDVYRRRKKAQKGYLINKRQLENLNKDLEFVNQKILNLKGKKYE